MNNELIAVRQLPIIEEQLQQVKASVELRIQNVLAMACTEETRADVKQMRTQLRKEFDQLEQRRKEVKTAVLDPYNRFEQVYKDCVADLYRQADRTLAERVTAVEDGLKRQKSSEVQEFFEEYRTSLAIPADLLSWERAGIKVTMTTTAKRLKEQAISILEGVAGDLAAIQATNNCDEIMVEYRKSLNLSQAVRAVEERRKQAEQERVRREKAEADRIQREKIRQEVETVALELATPVPAPISVEASEPLADDPVLEVVFKVKATRSRLRELKQYLNNGGYIYE